MGPRPIVSICIPCYNSEPFIADTLESVLKQTFTNFELVIADDKSTDRTLSIIKTFRDPRIRLFENDSNLGLGGNWNKVLSCSRGKYVKLLGGDDLLYPECLSRQVAVLEGAAHDRVVLAVCNREVINGGGKVIMRRRFPFKPGVVNGPRLIRKSIRWGSNIIGEPAVGLFRREVMNRTTLCDPSNPYAIDLAFWAELLKHGDAFVDPAYLSAFRISGKATSARIGASQAAYFNRFVRQIRANPFYRVSAFDAALGRILSLQWCLLRNLFINSHSTC